MELYSILIQYDNIDKIYIASVPELPGCIAHGDTQESAIKEVRVVAEMWIEVAQEEGRIIPQPSLYEAQLVASPAV